MDELAELVQRFEDAEASASDDLVAPRRAFEVPEAWLAADQQLRVWAVARERRLFGLELATARALLRQLLEQNRYLRGGLFVSWPSRDRHQLWAALWIALRLVPQHRYSAAAFEGFVAAHLAVAEPRLVVAAMADIERRELVRRDGERGVLQRREAIEFVLDGDKLFAVRAAVVCGRPWWALPLSAQALAAPRTAAARPATSFRCVLLDPEERYDESRLAVDFVPVGGGAAAVARPSSEPVAEAGGSFCAFECEFPHALTCSEVRVRGVGRVPPFRIDVLVGEQPAGAAPHAWAALTAQPMPSRHEMCNEGRAAVRSFLPCALPLAPLPDGLAARCKQVGDLLDSGEPPVLRGWPRKHTQQAAASLWLALHMVPGLGYAEAEVDWLIATHHTRARVPDCPTIRKELEAQGLVTRQPGGGAFQLEERAASRALLSLSIPPAAHA